MNALERIRDGFAAVGRTTFSAAATIGRGASMVFTRSRAWGSQVLFMRTNIDYARQVGDPMHNSAVVAVVGWIARNFPEAPVRIWQTQPDGTREPVVPSAAGPGFLLRLLKRPNKYFSGVLLWVATVVDWYTTGNAYWLKIRNDQGRVVELWWAPSKFMEPRGDEKTFITHYDYNPNGIVYQVDPDDVFHLRDGADPDNPRKGRSQLSSLLREIYSDDEAANFTAQLLTNLGVPGVVIAPANTTSGSVRAQPEQVKQKFIDTFGGDRRGDPLVLSAPTEIKVLSFSPSQMNLKDLRRVPEERISAVLGIAAGVVGLGAGLDRNTFSNFGEARAAAYEESVIPKQRIASAEMEIQLLDEFADLDQGYEMEFDVSKVRALASYVEAIWKRGESAATKGLITRAAFKRMTDQPVDPDGDDDVYVIAGNYVIIDEDDGTITRLAAPKGIPSTDPTPIRDTTPEPGEPVAAMAALTEARCPECDKLLGYDVTGGRLWCSRCKAERSFGPAAVAA